MAENKLVIVIDDESDSMPSTLQRPATSTQGGYAVAAQTMQSQTAIGGLHQQSRMVDVTLSMQRAMEQRRRQSFIAGEQEKLDQMFPKPFMERLEERRREKWEREQQAKLASLFPDDSQRRMEQRKREQDVEERRRSVLTRIGAAGVISGMADSGTLSGIAGQGVAGFLAGEALAGTRGGVTGAIVGATLATGKMIVGAIKEQTARIAVFSPGGALAQAEANVRGILGDIRRGRENEKAIAQFITTQSELQQSWEDFKIQFMPIAVAVMEGIKLLVDLLGGVGNFANWLPDQFDQLWDWAFGTRYSIEHQAADAKETKENLKSIERHIRRWFPIFPGTYDETFLEGAISAKPTPLVAVPPAPAPFFGGLGVP